MIFLLAGHHKKDPGAVSGDLKENVLNRELQILVLERLESLAPNLIVYTDPFDLTLTQVINEVNKRVLSSDLLLEIHFDSATNASASGSTVLVANDARSKSIDFATDLVNLVSSVLDIPNRGVKTEKESNRGRLGILHTAASSVLLEVGFIINPNDMAAYEKFKHWVADEITRTIIKHAETT